MKLLYAQNQIAPNTVLTLLANALVLQDIRLSANVVYAENVRRKRLVPRRSPPSIIASITEMAVATTMMLRTEATVVTLE